MIYDRLPVLTSSTTFTTYDQRLTIPYQNHFQPAFSSGIDLSPFRSKMLLSIAVDFKRLRRLPQVCAHNFGINSSAIER
jgi:hypothetical protein